MYYATRIVDTSIGLTLQFHILQADEIKQNAQKYVAQIADVLAKVDRQMLLIFKTNDLLRAMEHTLGTQNAMAGFVQMSRSCIR